MNDHKLVQQVVFITVVSSVREDRTASRAGNRMSVRLTIHRLVLLLGHPGACRVQMILVLKS